MKIIITEEQFKKLINEDATSGLIVYHGTNTKINKFVDDFIGGDEAIDANGPGIYFSDTEVDSEHFGPIMYTVRLNSNKFLTDKSKKGITPVKAAQLIKMKSDWQMNAQDWDENPNVGINMFLKETFSNEENAKEILLTIWISYYRYNPLEFARNCVKLGIDGINVTNHWGGGGSSEHYIVYNPAIIEVLNVKNGD